MQYSYPAILREDEARRLLDPDHAGTLPRMTEALRAVGCRVVVKVEAA